MIERRWREIAVGAGLMALLIGVYFLTFSGYAISGDEWALFDATESLARRADTRLNFLFDQRPPLTLAEAEPPRADTEPLQPVLAVPLFWLAQALPGIGLAHTVWLFNILTTALTAVTLYAYGVALGYRVRAAALVAVGFGLGTIVWPYSRTFFREPLFGWLALLSAYLMLRIRQQLAAGRHARRLVAAFTVTALAAVFSKEAGVLLVPSLAVAALPGRSTNITLTRRALLLVGMGLLALVALTLILLNLDTLLGISSRYAFAARLDQARSHLGDAAAGVRGYLYSPARGIWWFSPVLLLGFTSWPHLIRTGRWRELAVPLAMLVTFAVGYAVVRGPEWYGGRGWGPRYMLPVTPFLALWLLPVAQSLIAPGAARWVRAGALLVMAVSVGVQLVAVVIPIEAYYAVLAARTPPVIPWLEGAWQVRWSPLFVSLRLLGDVTPDLAWRYAAGPSWLQPMLAIVLVLIAGAWLAWWLRQPVRSQQGSMRAQAALAVVTLAALLGGLYAIRLDRRYHGDFAPARALLSALEPRARPDDVILLSDGVYREFFMNFYKRRAPAVYTLPLAPGERFSDAQAVPLDTPFADERIHLSTALVTAQLAQHHERLWLVVNSSRFVPWSLRPVEEYLSRHYFAVSALEPHDLARAVSFELTHTAAPTAPAWPAQRSGATFGNVLELVGFDLPAGLNRLPGEVVTLSLLWRALEPLPHDYSVAVLVVGPDGSPVAQRDSLPVNGFGTTSTWRAGGLYRDNHGVELPADLPPGDYELWVAVYWWQAPADRLPVAYPDTAVLDDHALLGTIVVAP